jgi:[acyl-carrier-protein] S-malonyltransferase
MIAIDRTAFVFPGVAVRQCGAEREAYRRHKDLFAPRLEAASRTVDQDLVAALEAGTLDALPDRHKQHFTYAFSVAAAEAFAREEHRFDLLAGYSFGLYAALAASGAVSFHEGAALLSEACRLMSEASAGRPAGMAAVIGLTESEARALLTADDLGTATLVNSNSDVCHIFSGLSADMDALVAAAQKQGAISATRLGVDTAYHHPQILASAVPPFRAFAETLEWHDPAAPVVSSIDQSLLGSAAALRDLAARNLATPFSWRRIVNRLVAEGVHTVVECGPGVSLTQNGRFMDGGLRYVNVRRLACIGEAG